MTIKYCSIEYFLSENVRVSVIRQDLLYRIYLFNLPFSKQFLPAITKFKVTDIINPLYYKYEVQFTI